MVRNREGETKRLPLNGALKRIGRNSLLKRTAAIVFGGVVFQAVKSLCPGRETPKEKMLSLCGSACPLEEIALRTDGCSQKLGRGSHAALARCDGLGERNIFS